MAILDRMHILLLCRCKTNPIETDTKLMDIYFYSWYFVLCRSYYENCMSQYHQNMVNIRILISKKRSNANNDPYRWILGMSFAMDHCENTGWGHRARTPRPMRGWGGGYNLNVWRMQCPSFMATDIQDARRQKRHSANLTHGNLQRARCN